MPGIIVGVDGSTHSRRALEWAIKEAASRQTPLTVVTVHQPYRGFWNAAVEFPGDAALVEAASKAVQEETDDALAKLAEDARPPVVNVMAVEGQPADRILRAAVSTDADMIVLGSRGAGGFAKLLMGSVASQVSHHAHCPVMVVRPET
jgi:nucleotide-binding universal stress UspA family protein